MSNVQQFSRRLLGALAIGASLAIGACSPQAAAPTPAAVAPAKPVITKTREELAREVVDLAGARDQIRLYFQTVFAGIISDPRVTTIAQEEINLSVEQFAQAAISVWSQEFTLEELNELATFYRSPVGRALVSKQPIVGEKLAPLGGKLGEALGKRIEDRVIAAGLQAP